MKNSNVEISIVIVSYNVWGLLNKCLLSIQQHVSNCVEIIVVDNDSKDESAEAIANKFPEVILIRNNFNAGFSGANNQGMSIAKGKYIFLLNPDTEIIGDTFSHLPSYLDNFDSCSIVAPQLLNPDGSIQISVWKNHHVIDLILETFYLHKLFNLLNYPYKQLQTTFKAETLSGAALFFRKSLILKIGMLDENLFWMEDIDFCVRAKQYGSITYLNSTQIYHHCGQSQKKNYNVAIANQLMSKLKYFKKHFSKINVFIAHLSCLIFIITRLLAFSLLTPFKEIYKLKAKAYLYSLKRYFYHLFINSEDIL